MLVLSIIIPIITGCRDKQSSENGLKLQTTAPAPVDNRDVVVVVDGIELTADATDAEVALRTVADQGLSATQLEKLEKQTRKKITEQFINRRTLLAEADRRKIDVKDPAVGEQRWVQVKTGKPGRWSSADILRIHLIGLDRTREDVVASVRIDALLEEVMDADVKVLSKDIEQYRKDYPELFAPPERAKCQTVYVEVAKNATDEVREAKRKQIDDIHVMLKDDDVFNQIKKQYANDSSSGVRCGIFSNIKPGEMGLAVVDEVIFTIETNTVSPVIESEHGYHIVNVISRKAGRSPNDGEIKYIIEDEMRQTRLKKFMENLLKKSNIK